LTTTSIEFCFLFISQNSNIESSGGSGGSVKTVWSFDFQWLPDEAIVIIVGQIDHHHPLF